MWLLILVLLALLVVVLWWALAANLGARKTKAEREPFARSDVDVLVPRYVRREHERHVTWVQGCPLCEHEIRVAHERKARS